MSKKIAFFDSKPYDVDVFTESNKGFDFDITFFEAKLNSKTASLAINFDGVCAFVNDSIDADVLEKLKNNGVQIIGLRCAGYNNVDFQSAYEKIHVVRVPAYSPYAVAEHAVALMMSLNRKTYKAYMRTRDGNFALNGLLGFDMHGKTAGVIGTGKIGRCLISILKGFGLSVLAYDPYPDDEYAKESGISYVSLEEIYKDSDIISLHCPLSHATEYMINKESISKMKFVINAIKSASKNKRNAVLNNTSSTSKTKTYGNRCCGFLFYRKIRLDLLNVARSRRERGSERKSTIRFETPAPFVLTHPDPQLRRNWATYKQLHTCAHLTNPTGFCANRVFCFFDGHSRRRQLFMTGIKRIGTNRPSAGRRCHIYHR